MYFEGDPLIKLCPMVNSIPDEKAINSLIGLLDTSKSSSHNILAYKFDIILRGTNQTYFENKKEGL
jgi:protocatechuate 3,4-dioxygenase beta subunit